MLKKLYFVLQVMQESVSGTAKIEGSYNKIIITIVPSYSGKDITHLLPFILLLMLQTCNNTDGNIITI